MSLETATLTTKFQLVADASAGVLDLAKLIPIVATPTLDLNVDYSHQIQIIFTGNNAVGKVAGAHAARALRANTADSDTAAVLRTLRSIRDATILNGQRP